MKTSMETIAFRYSKHAQTDPALTICRLMDAEDEICSLRQALIHEDDYEGSITITENADDEGYLTNPTISESTWIESIRQQSGLDVRAIIGDLPKELGLYSMKLVVKVHTEIHYVHAKVWIVPA